MMSVLNKMAVLVALSAASQFTTPNFVMPTTSLSPFIQFDIDIGRNSEVSFYEAARDFFLKRGSLPKDDSLTRWLFGLPEAEIVRLKTAIVFRMIDREGRQIAIFSDQKRHTSFIVVSHPGLTNNFSQQQFDDNQHYFSNTLAGFCKDFGCTFSWKRLS